MSKTLEIIGRTIAVAGALTVAGAHIKAAIVLSERPECIKLVNREKCGIDDTMIFDIGGSVAMLVGLVIGSAGAMKQEEEIRKLREK